MSETKETENKTATGRKTMSLNLKRTVEQGHIRQNFSHGRSKSVLVETKRKRPGAQGLTEEPQKPEPVQQVKPDHRAFHKPQEQRQEKRPQKVLRELSAGEVDARTRALIEARKREDIERREREREEARLREEAKKREAEEALLRAEEEVRRKAEEEAEKLKAAETAKTQKHEPAAEPAPLPAPPAPPAPQARTAGPIRKVGPDTRRSVVPPQPERRAQPAAGAPQKEGAEPAREDRRPPSRDGAGRDAARGPRSDGARTAGGAARPGGAGARPGTGPRTGAGAGARTEAAPALGAPGRGERSRTDGAVAVPRARVLDTEEDERRAKRGSAGKIPERPSVVAPKKGVTERTGRQRLTLSNALNEEQKERSLASLKRQRERQKLQALGGLQQERLKIQRQVQLPEAITI